MAHRRIELSADQIQVHGNQIQARADIGAGRVIHAILTIEDASQIPQKEAPFFGEPPRDQWERDLEELLALSPINHHPVDDSREAIYGPDPGEAEPT